MLDTPILFLIFNRPETTTLVFEQIRIAKPKHLFIAADGPSADKHNEELNCELVRKLVLDGIDWPCEVRTLFRIQNLGCGKAVSEAITWFFEHVEQGIILEDDCLPSQDFFRFCSDMLSRYKDKDEIMEVTGTNILQGKLEQTNDSYYFSSYGSIWGWATWRRAWKHYDFDMLDFDVMKGEMLLRLKSRLDIKNWMHSFFNVYQKEIDTWDYQWVYTLWKNKGICIVPTENLILNIGFGLDATHTLGNNNFSYLKLSTVKLPLNHPKIISVNKKSDELMTKFFSSPKKNFISRIMTKLRVIK